MTTDEYTAIFWIAACIAAGVTMLASLYREDRRKRRNPFEASPATRASREQLHRDAAEARRWIR